MSEVVAVVPNDGLGTAVAGSAPPLRIVNVTPLLLRANGKDLTPFEPVDCSWDPVDGIRVIHPSTGCRIKNIPASACFSISTLTIDPALIRDRLDVDFLQRYVRSGPAFPDALKYETPDYNAYHQLEVTNNSGHVVDVYQLDVNDERSFLRIEPGQTGELRSIPYRLYQFRRSISNEMIGMVIAGKGVMSPGEREKLRKGGTSPEILARYGIEPLVTLTGEFRQGWLKYQNSFAVRSSATRFSPVRTIGERRNSTPAQDDQAFITATTVRRDLSKNVFNSLKNRVLRDVEIAGVLLRWSGANRVLSNYYGEGAADIRSLTIYADRMEVSDRLRFPRANVTIHARELAFTGIGCIDTTPLPYAARAESEYLTQDPLDATNARAPADAAGNPTYTAKDGAKGEPAGNITLYVRRVIDEPGNTSRKRFICRGGKGQGGETGGLKQYVAKDGYPDQYGPLKPVTHDEVSAFFKDNNCGRDECWKYRWHGGVDWPNQMTVPHPAGNVLNKGQAVAVTLLAYCDDIGPTAFTPIAWGERGFLPGRNYLHWYNPRAAWPISDYSDKPDLEGVANPAKRPCDGRDAYPGGWPGDGGDGGVIRSVLASAPLPDVICDVGPGLPGDFTAYAPGSAPPGPTPAYAMRISIVKKSPIQSKRDPSVTVTDISGKPGKNAPGRHYTGTTVPSAPTGLEYGTRASTARSGRTDNAVQAEDLSWAHPAAVGAVLSYARTAYRNGFREEAAAALDPYFALIGLDPARRASHSAGLRLALAPIAAMGSNLTRNLDYYGNPPGWVPRLNALSNLDVLKSVRQAAYGTYYFSDKMLSDYESLDDARAVSEEASKALKAELETARVTLQTAYGKLPEAVRALDAVQQEVVPVQVEIGQLRDRAFEKTRDTIVAQRVFSAGMQILGGVAKALPVGQPFAGLAGSALGSVSQFDWNATDPLASARSSIDGFNKEITRFVTDNKDKVTAAVTSGLGGAATQGEALVTQLTRQLEDEEKEPKENADAAEAKWTQFKNEERTRLQAQINDTKSAITEIQQNKNVPDEAAADSFLAALNKQKATLDEKRLATLRTGLVDYRKQQADLEAQARTLARVENDKLKAAAARTTSSDIPPGVKEQLTAATRASEDQKGLIAAREATAKNVMSSLEGLGSGLGMIGNGIVSLATPLTADDPTWKRLAEQMLLDDPELHARGKALNQTLQGILGRKKRAAGELFFWQQQASTSAATIASNLGALTALSGQRQSLDPGLDLAVQGYLRETKERAKDALAQSIYWFVKSFQYEFLSDVGDTLYNFDIWTEKLRAQELVKKAAAAPGSVQTVGRDRTIVLAKEDFDKIGDEVFKAEQLKLGQELLSKRQQRGAAFQDKYQSCVLEPSKDPKTAEQHRANQMLDSLRGGEVSFNFIDDFGKGGYALNDARVVDVDLEEFVIESAHPTLSLTIRIEHSGESIIGTNTRDEGRVFYVFQAGRDDDPVRWQFVYNHSKKPEFRISKSATVDKIADNVRALLDPGLKDFKEYSPSLFSNYTIRIIDLDERKRKALKAINKVVLNVSISVA